MDEPLPREPRPNLAGGKQEPCLMLFPILLDQVGKGGHPWPGELEHLALTVCEWCARNRLNLPGSLKTQSIKETWRTTCVCFQECVFGVWNGVTGLAGLDKAGERQQIVRPERNVVSNFWVHSYLLDSFIILYKTIIFGDNLPVSTHPSSLETFGDWKISSFSNFQSGHPFICYLPSVEMFYPAGTCTWNIYIIFIMSIKIFWVKLCLKFDLEEVKAQRQVCRSLHLLVAVWWVLRSKDLSCSPGSATYPL